MTKEKSKEDKNLKYKIWASIAVMTTYINDKFYFIIKAVLGIGLKLTALSDTFKIYNTVEKELKGKVSNIKRKRGVNINQTM